LLHKTPSLRVENYGEWSSWAPDSMLVKFVEEKCMVSAPILVIRADEEELLNARKRV